MDYFEYRDGELWAEAIRVSDLVEQFGTPLYVYSAKTLRRHYHAFDTALGDLDHLTCFSVKANSNVNLLRLLGGLGAGVDIGTGPWRPASIHAKSSSPEWASRSTKSGKP